MFTFVTVLVLIIIHIIIDPDTITSIVSVIKDVFTNNASRLSTLLQNSIDEFAKEMLQEQLIGRGVSRNPTYTTIIDNFLAKLAFMTDKKKIEQHCGKFLKVLHNIGEQEASDYMKKLLVVSVRARILNVDLHLDDRL